MLGEFPQAIAMQHPNQPDDTILQSDAQCILLSSKGGQGGGWGHRTRLSTLLMLCDAPNMSVRPSVRPLVASLTRRRGGSRLADLRGDSRLGHL